MNRIAKYLASPPPPVAARRPTVPLLSLEPLGTGAELYRSWSGWHVLLWVGGREEWAEVYLVDGVRRCCVSTSDLSEADLQAYTHFAPIYRPPQRPAHECDGGCR